MKRSFADIMAGLDSERAQKVARKLPAWAAVDADRRAAGLDPLEFPSALSLEQCSSSATAAYKANLAVSGGTEAGTAPGNRASKLACPSTPCAPFQGDLSLSGGIVRGRGPSSGGRGPAQPDVSGGSCPLREVETSFGFAPAPPVPAKTAGDETIAASVPLGTVLDLTGGLGVDSWAFAQVAERVVYFERSEELAAAAGRNFQRLGAGNIDVRCETVTPQTELPEADLIYADPARRDAAGRKVFLLEDCTPDILTLLPTLLKKAPAVLVKLSPMADLAMLAERLGPALREIHVVECDGEVKELLCLPLRDNSSPEPEIVIARLSGQAAEKAHNTDKSVDSDLIPGAVAADVPQMASDVQDGDFLRFRMSEERVAEAAYAAGVQPGDVLLEPCPALLKAGAFRLPCARWGLRKLAPSTHLYLAPTDVASSSSEAKSAPADRPAPGLCASKVGKGFMAAGGFGGYAPGNKYFKAWRVREVLPFGAAAFKALKRRYPRADVTARNLPLGSAELQKRLGVASGGDVHIFGCRLADGSSVLLVTESA